MAPLIYENKTNGEKVHVFCLSVIFREHTESCLMEMTPPHTQTSPWSPKVCPLLLVLRLDATAAQTEVESEEKVLDKTCSQE